MPEIAIAEDFERVFPLRVSIDDDGMALADFTSQAIPVPSPSVPVFLDLPVIDESAVPPYFLLAVSGIEGAEWSGATLYRSSDAAVFSKAASVGTQATIGYAKTALATGSTTAIDTVNTLSVRLDRDVQLASVTEDELLAGANLAALGTEENGWELLAYQTATKVTVGNAFDTARLWTLSGLLRGLNGTEHMVGSHGVGDRFVLLDGNVVTVPVNSGEVGTRLWWKVVTLGKTIDETPMRAFAYQGLNLLPLPPAILSAERVARSAA